MKTADFLRKHDACHDVAKWAWSISDDMAVVWDVMIEQNRHAWLIWTATRPGVFPDSVLRKLACRFVRETSLLDDRKVWDLLTDERSRKAVEMAERYADGKATESELYAAHYAARAAYSVAHIDAAAAARAAYSVAHISAAAAALAAAYSADAAAYSADTAATADAAKAAAKSAQVRMIAALGNPFKRSLDHENS